MITNRSIPRRSRLITPIQYHAMQVQSNPNQTNRNTKPPYIKHVVAIMLVFGIIFIGFFGILQFMTYAPMFVFLPIFISAGLIVTATGIWQIKPWARKPAIIMMIITILVGLPGLLTLAIFYRSIRRLMKKETKNTFKNWKKKGGG